MKSYKYFDISEFDSPDEVGSGKYMSEDFVERLHHARILANIPFKITSGYRTQAHNQRVGGVPNSAHTKGLAADIACNDSQSRIKIVSALVAAGFRRIGIAESFIHVDQDGEKVKALWLY